MKSLRLFIFLYAFICTQGCNLIPQNVEFFQDKVKAVPTLNDKKEQETLRQTVNVLRQRADSAEVKLAETDATLKAQTKALADIAKKSNHSAKKTAILALDTKADNKVIESATETSTLTEQTSDQADELNRYVMQQKLAENAKIITDLTQSVQLRVGEPIKIKLDTNENVAQLLATMSKQNAVYTNEIKDYTDKITPNVGKKIDGTGVFEMGYFTYVGIVILLCMIVLGVLKFIAIANPGVGTGMKIASNIAGKALTELAYGGEKFKQYITAKYADKPQQVAEILATFKQAHLEEQSTETKEIVKKIT